MLSRQPTFQLSDRVSHELKVICRLIDADGGDGGWGEYGISELQIPSFPPSVPLLRFPLGFWERQANFVATCSTEIQSEGKKKEDHTDGRIWNGEEDRDVPSSLNSWPRGGVRILLGDANFLLLWHQPHSLVPMMKGLTRERAHFSTRDGRKIIRNKEMWRRELAAKPGET